MTDPDPDEALIAAAARAADRLDDLHLDLQLRIAVARRDVYAAHDLPQTADLWNRAAMAYDDVRRERQRMRREFSGLTDYLKLE